MSSQHRQPLRCIGREQGALIIVPNIPIPNVTGWGREVIGIDQRLLFIPDAKMIVTLPETNDRLVVHRFDIEESLAKAGIDYLYTTSRAPANAHALNLCNRR